MSPKRQIGGGDQADASEQDSAPEAAHPVVTGEADSEQKPAGPAKADAAPKPPDAPRKADPAPKTDTKPLPKPKVAADAKPSSTEKPEEPKTMADIMRFDLKIRKRRR